MIAVALLLAAQITGTSTGAVDARGRGAATAWEMRSRLMGGWFTKEEVVEHVTALPVDERKEFLTAWTMAAPNSEDSLFIRRAVQHSIDHHDEIEARTTPGRPKLPIEEPPPTIEGDREPDPPPKVEDRPEPFVAGLASFLFGLGIGNFYAGAIDYGAAMLILELLSGAALAIGLGADDTGLAIGGGVMLGCVWVGDWVGAYVNASTWRPARLPEQGTNVRLIDLRF
ncbi:MAG: hypothetical protein RMA76_03445 [Deltaproteobacteria bacterium]|jgi:hypothetical protein